VVGEGAVVHGRVERSVVWPHSVVHSGEVLVDAIRADAHTVLVR
jgi:ADP-glucose pyrophosphorylase